MLGVLYRIIEKAGSPIFDAHLLSKLSNAEVACRVPALSSQAWNEILLFYALDFPFPFFLCLAIAGSLAFGLRRIAPGPFSAGKLKGLMFLPMAAAMVDWLENVVSLWLLANFPPVNDAAVHALLAVRALKQGAMLVLLAAIAVSIAGVAIFVADKIKNRR